MDRRTFLRSALIAGLYAVQGNLNAAPRPLVLGIFPRRNVKLTYTLFTPMADYLSQQLGRKVIIESAKSFNDFWKNVAQRRYDIVHFNQYHYIVSHEKFGYQVFAANKELGRNTISGSIIVRKDSGINTLSDLKGKTVLFGGGKSAMQSYISATWLLRKAGLKSGDYIEKFALNPPNTIISTYFKRADASGSGDVVMNLDNVTKRIDISQLKFLAKTKPMAHLPWAIKSGLPDELKQSIVMLLTHLDNTAAGRNILQNARLDALTPIDDKDYDEHRKIIREVYGDDYGISILSSQ